MMTYKLPFLSMLDMIAALKTAMLNLSVMKLFTNDITPSVNSLVADFTEATFTGYAPVTLTAFSAPYLTDDDQGAANSPLATFAPASPFTVGEIVHGWFVVDATGDLVMAGRFDAPQNMNASGQLLQVLVRFVLGNPA